MAKERGLPRPELMICPLTSAAIDLGASEFGGYSIGCWLPPIWWFGAILPSTTSRVSDLASP